MVQFSGANLIAGDERASSTDLLEAIDPRSGAILSPPAVAATEMEVTAAVDAAVDAAPRLRAVSARARAALLRAIASALEDASEAIVGRAEAETALGVVRLRNEMARTTGQLRFLGTGLEGGRPDARVDDADASLTRVMRPVGPVVVFAASNFPLAFSVEFRTFWGDVAAE